MRLWLQVTLSAAALSIAAPASAQSLLATSEDAHQVASQYIDLVVLEHALAR